jgi:hypothetical protein
MSRKQKPQKLTWKAKKIKLKAENFNSSVWLDPKSHYEKLI